MSKRSFKCVLSFTGWEVQSILLSLREKLFKKILIVLILKQRD